MSNFDSMRNLDTLKSRALESMAERDRVENLIIVHVAEDIAPSTQNKIFKFQAVKQNEMNGPHHTIVLDDTGTVIDAEQIGQQEGVQMFSLATPVVDMDAIAALPEAITIDPSTNDLSLKECDTLSEVITVMVPKNVGVSVVDVYFLADTTGSMASILASVQAGANAILGALNGLGLDIAFGVGNYRDFPVPASSSYAFQHQVNSTKNVTDITNAINAWVADQGSDGSEGQFFALDQLAQPPGGSIGWRTGSKRIIVWFGDAPGHDPICAAISGAGVDITEASVTAKLVSEQITVLAISTTTGFPNGLDDDPVASSSDYDPFCTIGGTPGQATRIATATGGVFQSGIDATMIVDTIINLIKNAINTINNLKLVATGGTAPFVTSIAPAAGYGPLSGDVEHTLPFDVVFTGVEPCAEKAQVFTGTIDAVADGVVVASKQVKITVPPCKHSYSVKFICGTQSEDCGCGSASVRPGIYTTEINIHNYHDKEALVEKFVLPVVFAGAPIGREPKVVEVKARDRIVLPPNSATMDDCYRISELLWGMPMTSPMPLTIGFLQIVSDRELAVTVVYTATDLKSGSLNLEVEQIEGKLK